MIRGRAGDDVRTPVDHDSPPLPPLLRTYLHARYRVDHDGRALRLRVGDRWPGLAPARGRLHAMLTACNPGSVRLDDAENRSRMARLQQSLSILGIRADTAVSGEDSDWLEPACWLDNVEPAILDRLAVEFGQNACLIVDPDRWLRLRLYLDAWNALANEDPRLQCRN